MVIKPDTLGPDLQFSADNVVHNTVSAICNYVIASDGSGHDDKIGGGSCCVTNMRNMKSVVRVFAHCGTSTDRTEFEAALMGFQYIFELGTHTRRTSVKWLSDRMDMVGSARRDENHKPIFSRRSNQDLWARYAFYENCFNIYPFHVPRNSVPAQALTDKLSGLCREMMKDFVRFNSQTENIGFDTTLKL